MQRTSAGRRIEISQRDIELFKLLTRYRYLRSTYLHAFVGGASVTRFRERLGDLFHEGYLDRPCEQWEFADARHRPVVYEMGKGGANVLRAVGTSSDGCARIATSNYRQFLHALMICEALASIELAVCNTGNIRFISWPEIVTRAPPATQASSAPLHFPLPSGGLLVPDAMFGLEYRASGAKKYRFFALEADRGTMPIWRSNSRQTSYLGKLEGYSAILANQSHKTIWGIPNLLVLTLTTSAARASEIIEKLGTASPAFLFKAVDPGTLASPAPKLLVEPWDRAGHASICIAESS